jgi:hypothetical protein
MKTETAEQSEQSWRSKWKGLGDEWGSVIGFTIGFGILVLNIISAILWIGWKIFH